MLKCFKCRPTPAGDTHVACSTELNRVWDQVAVEAAILEQEPHMAVVVVQAGVGGRQLTAEESQV